MTSQNRKVLEVKGLTYAPEGKKDILDEFKEFYAIPIDDVIEDFIKNGGEYRWKVLTRRRDHLNPKELEIYTHYIKNLIKKDAAYEKKDSKESLTATEQIILGDAYYKGIDVERSYDRAKQYFEKVANQVKDEELAALALFKIGLLYCTESKRKYKNPGKVYKLNYKLAKIYFEKAKEKGCVAAARELGYLYHHGQGVSKNANKAFTEYMHALSKNDFNVYDYLIDYFTDVIKNPKKRYTYLQMAVSSGSTTALYEMACLYEPDLPEAIPQIQKDSKIARLYHEVAMEKGLRASNIRLADITIKPDTYESDFGISALRNALENPDSDYMFNDLRKIARINLILSTFNLHYKELFKACVAYDFYDPKCKPILFTTPTKGLWTPLLFVGRKISKKLVESNFKNLCKEDSDDVAEWVAEEKFPDKVVKSITHWIGEKDVQPIIKKATKNLVENLTSLKRLAYFKKNKEDKAFASIREILSNYPLEANPKFFVNLSDLHSRVTECLPNYQERFNELNPRSSLDSAKEFLQQPDQKAQEYVEIVRQYEKDLEAKKDYDPRIIHKAAFEDADSALEVLCSRLGEKLFTPQERVMLYEKHSGDLGFLFRVGYYSDRASSLAFLMKSGQHAEINKLLANSNIKNIFEMHQQREVAFIEKEKKKADLNPCKILGVTEMDDEKTIEKAFRSKSVELHPDKHANDPKKQEEFRRIVEAREILLSDSKRAEYDLPRLGDNASKKRFGL